MPVSPLSRLGDTRPPLGCDTATHVRASSSRNPRSVVDAKRRLGLGSPGNQHRQCRKRTMLPRRSTSGVRSYCSRKSRSARRASRRDEIIGDAEGVVQRTGRRPRRRARIRQRQPSTTIDEPFMLAVRMPSSGHHSGRPANQPQPCCDQRTAEQDVRREQRLIRLAGRLANRAAGPERAPCRVPAVSV